MSVCPFEGEITDLRSQTRFLVQELEETCGEVLKLRAELAAEKKAHAETLAQLRKSNAELVEAHKSKRCEPTADKEKTT